MNGNSHSPYPRLVPHDDGYGNSAHPSADIRYGIVLNVQVERGFGFLVDMTSGERVERFFHVSQLSGVRIADLRAGQRVRFTVEPERTDATGKSRGPRACNVAPVPA